MILDLFASKETGHMKPMRILFCLYIVKCQIGCRTQVLLSALRKLICFSRQSTVRFEILAQTFGLKKMLIKYSKLILRHVHVWFIFKVYTFRGPSDCIVWRHHTLAQMITLQRRPSHFIVTIVLKHPHDTLESYIYFSLHHKYI